MYSAANLIMENLGLVEKFPELIYPRGQWIVSGEARVEQKEQSKELVGYRSVQAGMKYEIEQLEQETKKKSMQKPLNSIM